MIASRLGCTVAGTERQDNLDRGKLRTTCIYDGVVYANPEQSTQRVIFGVPV